MKRTLIIFLCLAASLAASAVPADRSKTMKVTQPDGNVITLRIHGDEYLNWVTCGNTLVAKGPDGFWRRAEFNADGRSTATGSRIMATASGDGSAVRPPQSAISKAIGQRNIAAANMQATDKPSGNRKYLVLLVEFADRSFTVPNPKDAFTNKLNQNGYSEYKGTGSVRDYFVDNSHGKYIPEFDVVGPIKVPGSLSDYNEDYGQTENGVRKILEEACDIIDSEVDFSQYDLDGDGDLGDIVIIYAGYSAAQHAEGAIWPHKSWYYSEKKCDGIRFTGYLCANELRGSSGEDMDGIGGFCHEFSHTLGLPDFYDVNGETYGDSDCLYTLSLMDQGSYNNGSRTPPYMNYEERSMLGWDDGLTLLEAGALNQISPVKENKAYWYPTGNDGEYYLFESRKTTGWDSYIGYQGMVIYHVDKSDNITPSGDTAKQLWNDGTCNICSEHRCFDIVKSVPYQPSWYESGDLFFPGENNITSFTPDSYPAFVGWDGHPVGLSLDSITFDESTGISSFYATAGQRMLYGTVRTKSGDPIANADVTISHAETQSSGAYKTGIMTISPCSNAETIRCTTDSEGKFSTELSEAGAYKIAVSSKGYVNYTNYVEAKYMASSINVQMLTPIEGAGAELQKYSSIDNTSAMGFVENPDIAYMGNKYTSAELKDYVGASITSVSFFVNGSEGKEAGEMGVKIYFGNELVCTKKVKEQVFNTFCTVDVESFNLTIPSGKDVIFCYYLKNYGWQFPFTYSTEYAAGGDIWTTNPSEGWTARGEGCFLIKASLFSPGKMLDLTGFNYIPHEESYKAGDKFNLTLEESSTNKPSSVSWTMDGKTVSGSVTLEEGIHTVRAKLTYASGRTEIIEAKLTVTQ